MTDAALPNPPLITNAVLRVHGQNSHALWDLYAEGTLIGWTPEDPSAAMPDARPFTPSCWDHRTGQHVIVTYSPKMTVSS